MAPQFLLDFCRWIYEMPLSLEVRQMTWGISTVQSIHIAAIAVVMGSILMIDFRVLNLTGRSQSLADMTQRLMPGIWGALLVLFVTGAVLIFAEPLRSLTSPAFQVKMVLVVVAFAMTALFRRKLAVDAQFWERSAQRRTTARVIAVCSLAMFVGIIFAGRLIAYIQLD